MGEETSNKKTEPSNLSNMVIAKGKRKGESHSPALSLQDVFSESAKLYGRHQKTSCPVEIGKGKEAQLRANKEWTTKQQRRGSRKMIPPIEQRIK